LISNGVRCVVAAGWAVDDAAAKLFATRFYEALMDRRTFAEAVGHAREQTHQKYPQSNTWAAYQCYGDPDWRYVSADDSASGSHPRTVRSSRRPTYGKARALTLANGNR
jgi:CHAT domain-containing protein